MTLRNYEINSNSQPRSASTPVTTAKNAATITSTTPVVFKTVVNLGQETLFNSEKVSFNFAPIRRNKLGFLFFVFVAFAMITSVRYAEKFRRAKWNYLDSL